MSETAEIVAPAEAASVVVDAQGTMHIPPFAVPLSHYMSAEARAMLLQYLDATDLLDDITIDAVHSNGASIS